MRCLLGLNTEDWQVSVDEANLAGFDVVLKNLPPWPEGECLTVWSLEVSELHDRHGSVGRAQRVGACGCEVGAGAAAAAID